VAVGPHPPRFLHFKGFELSHREQYRNARRCLRLLQPLANLQPSISRHVHVENNEIRDELGLLPNTEVAFDVVDGEARLRKADGRRGKRLSRGDRVVGHLREVRASNKLSTDEIMAMMRGRKS